MNLTKQDVLGIALFLVLGSCVFQAKADYLSLSVTQSQWSDNNSRLYLFPDLATCESGCAYSMSLNSDNESSGWSLTYGKDLNRYFALEAGYMDLGKSSVRFSLDGNFTNCLMLGNTCKGTFDESMDFTVKGPTIAGVVRYPFGRVSVFYKARWFRASLETSNSVSVYNLDTGSGVTSRNSEFTETVFAPSYGVGFDLNRSLSVSLERMEFEVPFSAGQGLNHQAYFVDGEVSLKTTIMNLSYRF